mmetsp:Transcript_1946/g.2801  ORF Transcript_1946/g.2801 Transcript_1946/m.2801 type:complete len:167 (+) Transcript_1946:62-562(+)
MRAQTLLVIGSCGILLISLAGFLNSASSSSLGAAAFTKPVVASMSRRSAVRMCSKPGIKSYLSRSHMVTPAESHATTIPAAKSFDGFTSAYSNMAPSQATTALGAFIGVTAGVLVPVLMSMKAPEQSAITNQLRRETAGKYHHHGGHSHAHVSPLHFADGHSHGGL